MKGYQWRKGDVFAKGTHRWVVDQVFGNGLAVLRSCASAWATTNPLTYAEWNDDGLWRLESGDPKRPRRQA